MECVTLITANKKFNVYIIYTVYIYIHTREFIPILLLPPPLSSHSCSTAIVTVTATATIAFNLPLLYLMPLH